MDKSEDGEVKFAGNRKEASADKATSDKGSSRSKTSSYRIRRAELKLEQVRRRQELERLRLELERQAVELRQQIEIQDLEDHLANAEVDSMSSASSGSGQSTSSEVDATRTTLPHTAVNSDIMVEEYLSGLKTTTYRTT
ncbi:hypothetical protein DPMN_139714 [Dreissena polymorpha]|uniref:Uncharacterized protein n=1 Tax=Dreissena polymorpha TaxID=45954 RepID=A0A9D4G938_DREPO|nr:hypothetical protein DPMN_139714 [Dreissena polymorpha]